MSITGCFGGKSKEHDKESGSQPSGQTQSSDQSRKWRSRASSARSSFFNVMLRRKSTMRFMAPLTLGDLEKCLRDEIDDVVIVLAITGERKEDEITRKMVKQVNKQNLNLLVVEVNANKFPDMAEFLQISTDKLPLVMFYLKTVKVCEMFKPESGEMMTKLAEIRQDSSANLSKGSHLTSKKSS